jgi:hypothetical protein
MTGALRALLAFQRHAGSRGLGSALMKEVAAAAAVPGLTAGMTGTCLHGFHTRLQ